MADIKRTRTLLGSNLVVSKVPPLRTYPKRPTGHEDSLPSSPTYFAEVLQQERCTPSPNTQRVNKTFQQHLDSLGNKSKMQKLRVLDWIHQANPEPQEPGQIRIEEMGERKEERSVRADQRGPERAPRMDKSGLNMIERGVNLDESSMNMDDMGLMAAEKKQERMSYSTELISKTHLKKAPIYTSMDNPDSSVPVLESHSTSYARHSQDHSASGMTVKMDPRNGMEEQRYRMQPRFPTDSFVSNGPRRHNHPQGPIPLSRVRGGSEKARTRSATQNIPESGIHGRTDRTGSVRSGVRAQRSAVHPNSVQDNYPTARFEKDYYIIDV